MKTQDIKNLASAYMQVLEAEKKMDKVNPKALDKDFDDREDKDIDNDGDVDKSDEYLHNRRKAVKKAMKDDEMSEAKSAAQQAAIAIAKKEKGMSEDDDLDELSLSVKDFKKTGLNKTVTKNKGQLKKDIEAMKARLKKEEAELEEKANTSEQEAIQIISNSIAMKDSVVKSALKAANLDPVSVVTALKGKKTIKAMQLGNLVMGHAFGGSISKRDLAPIAKAASRVFKEEVELDEASDKVSQIQNYLKSKGGSTTKVVKGKDKDGSAKFTEIMPNNQKIIDSLKSRFQVQVVNHGPNKRALLVREEVELDEAAPKMQGDWLKKQRERDRAHNAAMGRTATGRKKPVRQMTSTQRSLAKLRGEETEVDEAMSKSMRRALQSVKAQPKDKVSLKPAPWDKKKDGKNMSMKEKLQLQKEAILEREMTDAEMKKREEIVKGMKKDSEDMKKRYGAKWKDVMYATATKQAMESVDKALSMTKSILTTKESFDTEDTKWPVYAKIKENRAMHTRGAAPGDPTMMDKMTASDKAFIDAHDANGLGGRDSGIDGAKAAEDTARNAAAQVKAGGGMNRTGDQKTGDKNIVKSTEAE